MEILKPNSTTRIIIIAILMTIIVWLLPTNLMVARAATYPKAPITASDGTVTWDCVWFGRYPQSSNGKGGFKNEPIKWRVLSVNGNDAFLLADKNLDVQPYNKVLKTVTWSKSTIRKWLNGYATSSQAYSDENFLKRAFKLTEQNSIKKSNVVTLYSENGGNKRDVSEDKVYLLEERDIYKKGYGFSPKNPQDSLRAKNTAYAKNKGAYTSAQYNGEGCWWLRNTGAVGTYIEVVGEFGYADSNGASADSKNIGVRPVLHIELSSNLWKHAGTVSSDGKVNESGSEDMPKPAEKLTFAPNSNYAEFKHQLAAQLSYFDLDAGGTPTVNTALDRNPKSAGFSQSNKVWKDQGLTYKNLFQSFLGDWKVIQSQPNTKSGFAAIALKNDKNKEIIIGYRGSEMNGSFLQDWVKTDFGFTLGNYLSPQFSDARSFYSKVKEKNPGYKVTLAGHSLGGALVSYVSAVTNAKGYSFDGAVGHVVDLNYFYGFLDINDFTGSENMTFTNYTDTTGYAAADIIQHTNFNYFYGVDRKTITNLNAAGIAAPSLPFYSHNPLTTVTYSADNKSQLKLTDEVKRYIPKANWRLQLTNSPSKIIESAWKDNSILTSWTKPTYATVALGTSQADTITAGVYPSAYYTVNVLYGGNGSDKITSYLAPDVIVAGKSGTKSLNGGLGQDAYIIDPDEQTITIDDPSGKNSIYFRGHGLAAKSGIKNISSSGGYTYFQVGSTQIKLKNNRLSSFKLYGFNNGKISYICAGKDLSGGGLKSAPVINTATASRLKNAQGDYIARSSQVPESLGKGILIKGLASVKLFDSDGKQIANVNNSQTGEYNTDDFSISMVNRTNRSEGEKDEVEQYILIQAFSGEYSLQVKSAGKFDYTLINLDENDRIQAVVSAPEIDLGANILATDTSVSTGDGKLKVESATGNAVEIIKPKLTVASERISFVKPGKSAIKPGETLELSVKQYPSSANDEVLYTVDNNNIGDIQTLKNGHCKITAKSAGKLKITAISGRSGVAGTIEIGIKSTVKAVAGTGGTVKGSGTYQVGTVTLTAMPKQGYRFVSWAESDKVVSRSYKYSFKVSKNRTVKANFAKIGKAGLTVKALENESPKGRINLKWKLVAGAYQYEVYRSQSKTKGFQKIKTVPAKTKTYIDDNLKRSTNYYYKIRVICKAGCVKTKGAYSQVKGENTKR